MNTRALIVLAATAIAATALSALAQVFPVLQGDPVDGLGRALPILPGVPLITANEDGDFKPPVVDTGVIGDVDLVVRAGHVTPGATMPPPALVPPVFAAGGSRFPGGTDIPFTVIASDGDPTVAGGHPLLGPELDGIPVLVFAFADLDRDGFIGPTNADPDGAADNAREMQEASYPVGMRIAYFTNGVAQGVVASDVGAPASSGGVPVVLTAAAYVGQFSPEFFSGTVPDGPAITTLQPFFPRLDPDRVLETDGSAGPGLPNGRIAIEFESEFEPPVSDPVLGTPFALPTDGSSVTIDRVSVSGAAATAARFVQPSSLTGLTGEDPRLPLHPGANGALLVPVTAPISFPVDGPGNPISVRIVPVDRLGNVTDPAEPLTIDLVLSGALAITSPDTDGDPLRESLSLVDGSDAVVTLDDGELGAHLAFLEARVDGAPVDRIFFGFTYVPNDPPAIYSLDLLEQPEIFSLACPRPKTLSATIYDPQNDVVGATAVVYDSPTHEVGRVELTPSDTPGVWTGPLPLPTMLANGAVAVVVTARDARGNESMPASTGLVVVDSPIFAAGVNPYLLPARKRTRVTVTARVLDDCGVDRLKARVRRAKRSKPLMAMNDAGKNGDEVAGDGVYTGVGSVRMPASGTLVIEVVARDGKRSLGSRQITLFAGP